VRVAGVVGHPCGHCPQVAYQVLRALQRPSGLQRLDRGFEVDSASEGQFGGSEPPPQEPSDLAFLN
jgi:hypothetical protein